MTPTKTTQSRAAIEAATVLIRKLDAMMKNNRATPQRLAELKSWQSDLIENNRNGDADLILRGIQQVEGYLTDEKKAAEAIKPRLLSEVLKEQAEHYRRANEQRKRDDDRFTRTGHLSKPK